MRLVEFDGKKLLTGLNIAIPEGRWINFEAQALPTDLPPGPWFVKAQVLQSSRGKRGWIKSTAKREELLTIIADLHKAVGEEPCDGFLIESATPHQSEWLLSCDIDRATGKNRLHLGKEGGQEVTNLQTHLIETEESWKHIKAPASVIEIARKIYESMSEQDILSVEINPLAVSETGRCIALDAKIELDDAAAFRHAEWTDLCPLSRYGRLRSEREAAFMQLVADGAMLGRYVELDGNVGMILSGGGASLVAMDALITAGGKPANYVEMSGNPDPDYVKRAAQIALSHPQLRGIWIAGSFANFTDIRATVMAILTAIEESSVRVPVVIRRDGPQVDEAEREALAWAKRLELPLRFHRANVDLDTSVRELLSLMK